MLAETKGKQKQQLMALNIMIKLFSFALHWAHQTRTKNDFNLVFQTFGHIIIIIFDFSIWLNVYVIACKFR